MPRNLVFIAQHFQNFLKHGATGLLRAAQTQRRRFGRKCACVLEGELLYRMLSPKVEEVMLFPRHARSLLEPACCSELKAKGASALLVSFSTQKPRNHVETKRCRRDLPPVAMQPVCSMSQLLGAGRIR